MYDWPDILSGALISTPYFPDPRHWILTSTFNLQF